MRMLLFAASWIMSCTYINISSIIFTVNCIDTEVS